MLTYCVVRFLAYLYIIKHKHTTHMTALATAQANLTAAKANFTKAAIMRKAWSLFKSWASNVYHRADFASALRLAWSEAKSNLRAAKDALTYLTSTKNGRKAASQSTGNAAHAALKMMANPAYASQSINAAYDALAGIIAKGGFTAQVAETCKKSGRISEKQLAILLRAC